MACGGSYVDSSLQTLDSTSNILFCNKKLINTFGDDSNVNAVREPIKVYLRVKPPAKSSVKNPLQIIDSKTILTKPPEEIAMLKKKLNEEDTCKYTFSHIFGPETSQREVFRVCALGLVKDFLNGNSSVLFTYGSSSAGKTYTAQGQRNQPGIIPRLLAIIFKTVSQNLVSDVDRKPDTLYSVSKMTKDETKNHLQLKNVILNSDVFETASDVTGRVNDSSCIILSEAASTFMKMRTVLDAENERIDFDKNIFDYYYSVWVSCAEIYNEAFYDLLRPVKFNCARKKLKLAQDKEANIYLKNLSFVNVKNEEEAYKVMLFGKNNQHVASTGLNKHSSRSHCIFTVILIKTDCRKDPKYCQISRLSICDLAGVERVKKTLNVNDRLAESKNINSSLHVLSKCFSAIRDNQNKEEKCVVPYRESKLTNLFKQAFCGKETVSIIVNVSSDLLLFNETQQVLKTSAIAKNILTQLNSPRIQKCARSARFSRVYMKYEERQLPSNIIPVSEVIREECSCSSMFKVTSVGTEFENQKVLETLLRSVENLKDKNEGLKQKLSDEKEKNLTLEVKVRKEVLDEMRKIIDKIETRHKNRLEEAEKVIKELRSWKESKSEELEEYYRLHKKKMGKYNEPFDCSVSMIYGASDIQKDILGEDIKRKEEKIDNLKKLINNYKEEEVQLKDNISKLTLELNVIKNKFSNIKEMNQLTELNQVKSNEYEKVVRLEKENEEKDKIISEAIEEIKLHESNQKAYEEQIASLQNLLKEQENIAESVIQAEQEFEQRLDEQEEEIDRLNNEIMEKVNALANIETEYEIASDKLGATEEKIVFLNQQLQQQEQEIDDNTIEIERLKSIIVSNKDENDILQKHLEKQWEKVYNLEKQHKKEIDDKTKEIERLKSIIVSNKDENKILLKDLEKEREIVCNLNEQHNKEIDDKTKEIERLKSIIVSNKDENKILLKDLEKEREIVCNLNEQHNKEIDDKTKEIERLKSIIVSNKDDNKLLQKDLEKEREKVYNLKEQHKKKCITSEIKESQNLLSPFCQNKCIISEIKESQNLLTPLCQNKCITSEIKESQNLLTPLCQNKCIISEIKESQNLLTPLCQNLERLKLSTGISEICTKQSKFGMNFNKEASKTLSPMLGKENENPSVGRNRSKRKLLSTTHYYSDSDNGPPEDPPTFIESPLSQYNRMAPLSTSKRQLRPRKKN
ncbi:uncharacterized protein LOC142327686 isoform X4 [Lycorma delicatula]|uniref:uncharacterized protein LOC142327686 isoform X2 n=1 Tax=Lycorma delicatula TaxID=130591 RepID=UPI003F5131AA